MLDKWKKELTLKEKELFQFIYDYYKENNAWPNSRIVQIEFEHFNDIYKWGEKLGYQFIRTGNPDVLDNISELSIFGVALCDDSEHDINIFMDFLKLAVNKVRNKPLDDTITEIDIRNSIEITDNELQFLSIMLNYTDLTRGVTYDKNKKSFNGILRFQNIRKYKDCKSFEDYIQLNLEISKNLC